MANYRTVQGVGLLFNPALADFVRSHSNSLDFLSVIPDRLWIDHGKGSEPRFEDLSAGQSLLAEVAQKLPLTMHCTGMSICSAGEFDEQYLDHLAQWRQRFRCDWVSEHLSFSRSGAGHETNAAVALPVPYDREMLDLVAQRVQIAQDRLECPFLLENNVYYVTFPGQDLSEPEFLNQLMNRTGCHLLLDLHNVYTNALNHRFDPLAFLNQLDLSRVLEIHVAGGTEMMGFYTDSHSGPVNECVWELLSYVAPRAPALRAVTFEFHESSWPTLHTRGVLDQVERARSILAAMLV